MVEQLTEAAGTLETISNASELHAWMQLTRMLLSAVSDHAVRDGETDPEPLQQRIQAALIELEKRPTPAMVLATAGSVTRAIANHAEQTQPRIDSFLAELRSLRDKAVAVQVSPATETIDACTGLPNRAEAEEAIRRAVAGEDRTCVAAFYLHRMNLANARFGRAIGDQVISFCSQHLATVVIKEGDALYRWSGPAFVAILRVESHLSVNEEVQRAASAPVRRFFETDSRTVYLPIKLTGSVIHVGNQACADVIDQIERFILDASGAASGVA